MSIWRLGCSRGAKDSRSEVENPESLWEARLAKWGGGAGQGGQVRGSRKQPSAGVGVPVAGVGLRGEDGVLGEHVLPLSPCIFSVSQRSLFVPADGSACFSLRSRVSVPAGQDLGAAHAPGVRMGTGVTRSRSAEVRGHAREPPPWARLP